MSALLAAKRLVRPLIPDRIMARYRLRQHSRQVRSNVDVVIAGGRERRRWLATTPDTYRVIDPDFLDSGPRPMDRTAEGHGEDGERAARLLVLPDVQVGVVGEVAPPRLVGRRRVEPAVRPTSIAASAAVLAEVGGLPAGTDPLPGLLARLRDAGRRIALEPVPSPGLIAARRGDPIEGTPVVILAAVPIPDVGGGSRAAQLALELLRRGCHVTYVALFASQESVDLGLRYIHPRLEQLRSTEFSAGRTVQRSEERGVVVIEVPAAAYCAAVRDLRSAGWKTVYDVIDDWSDPALGGDWYQAPIEKWYLETADVTTASAPDLVDRAAAAGAHPVLVSNAVNAAVFGGGPGPAPPDLDSATDVVFGYHGSLYGDWFDWESLAAVAAAHPEAEVVVIGDTKEGVPRMPPNVSFLGLKAQSDLPGYLQRFDVGLLPFRVTPTTHAVSPLKVYEYLASGVPVAAPPLRSLEGLDGVYTADDLVTAAGLAIAAPRPDRAGAADAHSWEKRVDQLLAAVGVEPTPFRGVGVKVVRRPAVHYARRERDVRGPAGNLQDS